MKNYKLTLFFLFCSILVIYSQDVTFNVDLNGTIYPESGNDIRIGGNVAGTGWTPDILTLTDGGSGIYSGTAINLPVGQTLFRIWQGTAGIPGWASGDWISDITGFGCPDDESDGANYEVIVVNGEDPTITLVLNECLTTVLLSNVRFEFLDISVYPNPAENFITIQTTRSIDSISIYNLLGSKILENMNYNQSKGLDISQLKSGIYLLHLESEGVTGVIKFIKK